MMRLKKQSTSGAALLTVLVAMMIISIILFEFQYSSMVERKLAYNELNQIQAYYLAKSGAHIGLLRVALYGKLLRNPQVKQMASQGMDVRPYLQKIWDLPLPAFPPVGVNTAKLSKPDKDAAEKVLQQTKIKEGSTTHVITSESSKINLNFLAVPTNMANQRISIGQNPTTVWEYVASLLMNLLENFLRDSERPYEEYGNLRPEELVMDIMDWVSPGSSRLSGGSKDSFYEQQKPPYKAKRGRFFSVDELRMVRGIDEHLFNKLKPYVTVYSYEGKINLNTATGTMYRALYRDFTEDDVKRILEARDKQGGWLSEKQFVDFVSNSLGRSGFTSLYSNAGQYPFTVGSQSFLIESIGRIERSKSTIQRTIRVGVALTRGKGGQILTNIGDPASCNQAGGAFWDKRDNRCKTTPSNSQECVYLGATWMQQGDQWGCKINNEPIMFPPGSGPTGGAAPGAGTPGGTAGQSAGEPNVMRILYWNER